MPDQVAGQFQALFGLGGRLGKGIGLTGGRSPRLLQCAGAAAHLVGRQAQTFGNAGALLIERTDLGANGLADIADAADGGAGGLLDLAHAFAQHGTGGFGAVDHLLAGITEQQAFAAKAFAGRSGAGNRDLGGGGDGLGGFGKAHADTAGLTARAGDRLFQRHDLLLQCGGNLLRHFGGALHRLVHQFAMAARQFLDAFVLELDRRGDAGNLGGLGLEDATRGFHLAHDHVGGLQQHLGLGRHGLADAIDLGIHLVADLVGRIDQCLALLLETAGQALHGGVQVAVHLFGGGQQALRGLTEAAGDLLGLQRDLFAGTGGGIDQHLLLTGHGLA